MHTALKGIKGVVDLRTELQVDVPYIRVKPDLEKAAKYGLKPGDIRRAAATIVAGDEVSDLHVDSKVYDIIAWSVPERAATCRASATCRSTRPAAAT